MKILWPPRNYHPDSMYTKTKINNQPSTTMVVSTVCDFCFAVGNKYDFENSVCTGASFGLGLFEW